MFWLKILDFGETVPAGKPVIVFGKKHLRFVPKKPLKAQQLVGTKHLHLVPTKLLEKQEQVSTQHPCSVLNHNWCCCLLVSNGLLHWSAAWHTSYLGVMPSTIPSISRWQSQLIKHYFENPWNDTYGTCKYNVCRNVQRPLFLLTNGLGKI